MVSPIRVLVVDDSVVIRRLVSNILADDPGIEVVGTAANGRIALAKLEELKPEVITLDVEMPELDGIETLAALHELHVSIPVIMFSTLTASGAAATLEALALGAADYVTKPSNTSGIGDAGERVRESLVPKIHALGARSRGRHLSRRGPSLAHARPVGHLPSRATERDDAPGDALVRRSPPARPSRVEIVAIGVSTGGPNALTEVIPALPGSLQAPIVIVQHMPPTFTRLLAERLDTKAALHVVEASEPMALEPGNVYLAPGGEHLVLRRQGARVWTALDNGPPEHSCRPAVDKLFRSVADLYGASALAVVLTGMGQDGLLGTEAICERGGRAIVQDEESSVVWGMPGFVARAGLAEQILPLDAIAPEISRRVAAGASPCSARR